MIFLKQVNIHSEKFPVLNYYPFSLKIFQQTENVIFNNAITFFTGENGTGKSTLLKAMAIRCGIHIWQSEFNLRYKKNPYEDHMYRYITVDWKNGSVPGSFFGSQIFSHFTKNLEEWALADEKMLDYFGGKSLITQSHGQSLMTYFKSRYKIKGLYFLDEPETALSPLSLIELLNLLIKTAGKGRAQFIIATHSPLLLATPDSTIYSFDNKTIEPVNYKDTDYYKIYHSFMNNPEAFIKTG